jgi:hypothetical protein
LGPGFMVVLDVHVAPMHIQWGRLRTLQLLHSRRQQHIKVVPLHAVHLLCMHRQDQLGIFPLRWSAQFFLPHCKKGGLFIFEAGQISLYARRILLGWE